MGAATAALSIPLLSVASAIARATGCSPPSVYLGATAEDRRQVREALLDALGQLTFSVGADRLVARVVQLASTAEDQRQALNTLLQLMASHTDASLAKHLADGIVRLSPVKQDRRQGRGVLLGLLEGLEGSSAIFGAEGLVAGMVQLAPTVEEKREARQALLRLLVRQTDAILTKHIGE
jgi:hypothetical protein